MLNKLLILISLTLVATSLSYADNKSSLYYKLLDDLLVANIAANRDEHYIAMTNYMTVAKNSSDPYMAQLATGYAVQIQDPLAALEMVELWASLAPENLQAQIVAVTLTIDKKPDAAGKYLTNAIAIKPENIDQHLLEIFLMLSDRSREKLKQVLYTLAAEKPVNAYILLAAAQIGAQLGDIKQAANLVDASLKINPSLSNSIELKAKLIHYNNNSDSQALAYLDKMVQEYPNDAQLRLFFAKALIDNEQDSKAILHLDKLVQSSPDHGEAMLVLGKLYLDKNDFNLAKKYLEQAVNINNSSNIAKYLLAKIAEQENNLPTAINWYSQVEDTEIGVVAKLRAAMLLTLEKKYTEAIEVLHSATPETLTEQKQLLLSEIEILIADNNLSSALKITNSVLELDPADLDFLYARSLIHSLNTNWYAAEQDLLTMLQIDPENKEALETMQKLKADNKIPNFSPLPSNSKKLAN